MVFFSQDEDAELSFV